MKFLKWIELQGGPNGVAKLLGITNACVRAWMRGQTSPKVVVLQRLVKLSKGALTYDDVINATKYKRKKK